MKKWILRILVVFAVMSGLALFALKILSGTSDSHRRGLEQAFSQIFSGTAQFGDLEEFNLFPQFSLRIKDANISNVAGHGSINAGHLHIAFGSFDLLTKSKIIEKFSLKDLKISEGVFTPASLTLADASIYDVLDNTQKALFTFKGSYANTPIAGQIDMKRDAAFRPRYSFNDTNLFTMTLGDTTVKANFHPNTPYGAEFSNIYMTSTARAKTCTTPAAKTIPIGDFMNNIIGRLLTITSAKEFTTLCKDIGA